MEKTVAEIWRTVLDLEDISVHDNFFQVGGNSLQSVQVIDKLEKKTGLSLNIRQFIYQTLGQLAASLEQQTPVRSPSVKREKKNRFWQVIKKAISSNGFDNRGNTEDV